MNSCWSPEIVVGNEGPDSKATTRNRRVILKRAADYLLRGIYTTQQRKKAHIEFLNLI